MVLFHMWRILAYNKKFVQTPIFLRLANINSLAMMVDLSLSLLSHAVHEGVEKNLCEGNQLGENEPDVNHLDISSWRKLSWHTDEQSCEDKEGSQVHGDHGFKEKRFKEVGCVHNGQN